MIFTLLVFACVIVWLGLLALYHRERAGLWRDTADMLATELRKHGWGDFHYGDQPQDACVVTALRCYERAKAADNNERSGSDG